MLGNTSAESLRFYTEANREDVRREGEGEEDLAKNNIKGIS